MPPSLFPIAIKCAVMKSNKELSLCSFFASAECAEQSLAHAMFPYNAHQAGLANFRILSRTLSGFLGPEVDEYEWPVRLWLSGGEPEGWRGSEEVFCVSAQWADDLLSPLEPLC